MRRFLAAMVLVAAPVDGTLVKEIRISGLIRSNETSLRWLLGAKEGEPYAASKWVAGIERLLRTESFYDVETKYESDPDGRLRILLSVKDKWTLLPDIRIRSGGGQSLVGGGLQDVNFLGNFTEVRVFFASQSGAFYYNLYLEQEYIRDTPWRMSLDLTRDFSSLTLKANDGSTVDTLSWSGQLFNFGIGYRLPSRWQVVNQLNFHQDSFVAAPTTSFPTLNSGVQLTWYPFLQWGNIVPVNDQDSGERLTFGPEFTFSSGGQSYAQALLDWKQVVPLSDSATFVYRSAVRLMGQAPTLRWPQLGGYDTVRGFSASRALGRELIVGNFELRHRLIGLRLPLADLATLQATVFMDAGAVRSHLGGSGLGLLSGGLGLRLNFVKFARALIRMEFAQTIQPSEGWDLTFGLGSFF